jgi:hypothetical protein
MLETPSTDTQHQKKTAKKTPKKCTDSNIVLLITIIQQIMMGLQIADAEQDRCALTA